ncbi:DnaB-like helicase C-terminal domain-containing protein [Bacteroides uniformis]|jgi:replicative DNA helicase|uniref:replicative DNA helicase n=1 Tax=Bacteroides uniformis TaxID=820 RepID=UPI00233E9AA7|nr:DnaB-like helicase C-terminal domain-containing protein [Bacteroides uniformis]MDC1811248.1 DnaB-like helicase C-terminal domain-containing protein [Bacteroides uniformis]
MEIKVQLRDEDAEKTVLGTIIAERDAIEQVRDILSEECFYNHFHAEIYKAILQVVSSGNRADLIFVKSKLEENGVKFDIVEYMKIVSCHTFDLYQYASRLHDLRIRRAFYSIGQYLVSNSYTEAEDIEDVAKKVNDDMASLFKSSSTTIYSINEGIENVYKMINENLSGSKPLTGTPTGFEKIDSKSGGLQKSDLIIVAGETSQGKTSLAVSMMRNASISDAKIAMYSMEMKKEQIAARILSMESGVSSNQIMYSRLTDSQIQAIDKGIGNIIGKGIYFDDRSTSNIDTIISSIRYMKLKHDIDGAIVDYLQILNVNMKGANKEQQMGDVARRLKNLAKDLDIWIIALSQLNRDKDNPVPSLARLRDSGQIAEAADVVMLIYRPEVKGKNYPEEFSNVSTKNTAMIDIAKGRNIGIMKFICGFNPSTTMFYNLDSVPVFGSTTSEMVDENPF